MKKVFWILTSILALMLSACGTSATPTAIPTVSLDSASQPSSGKATASAIVVPVQKIELSFPLSGAVKTVEVAAGDSVTAGQPLITLETAILEARVKEAEANVVTVQTQLTYLKRVGTSRERLDAAQANIDSAQAAVDIAKAQLAQATLAAPFDGTIASVEISPAEFVNPGQIVIVMGDLSHFQIETTDMSEKDVPAVKIGQAASVFIDALNQDFSGKVVDIARFSETVGGDVVFKVTIELDDQPEGLRWGMSAEVNIETK
jgi:RND family efflux transporter MFP subunit